jgi:CheY-like chemotaxis protein
MLHTVKGKRILVVDDEPDVCQMIVDDFPQCTVETAATYEDGRAKLSSGTYDVIVLDIMGVRGYDLLDEFGRKAPCIMLTAHALTAEDLKRSIDRRAVLYLPKEELARLDEYIAKVIGAREPLWGWLSRRIDFGRWFGRGWMALDDKAFRDLGFTDAEIMKDLEV